jgi:hypothetical protein
MDDDKHEFLIGYDYGNGGLWCVLLARSEEELRSTFPTLEIIREAPPWMTGEARERIYSRARYDIDEEPRGVLKSILADQKGC